MRLFFGNNEYGHAVIKGVLCRLLNKQVFFTFKYAHKVHNTYPRGLQAC